MSFLACTPSVFVIGDEYEILLNLRDPGLVSLSVGDETYYEENSGALRSERTVCRIRLPQVALDAAGRYEIIYRKTVERKAYFSLFEDEVRLAFTFTPVPKDGPVNIYYIADVHYAFETALKTVDYFGDALHLLIANGDLGEVETEENYLEVCEFLGVAAGGRVPIVMARGNHDTRGRLAEKYTEYFPANGKKTYYTFEVGPICGIVLDFGEDKLDICPEYDSSKDTPVEYLGINRFHAYREQELAFLKTVQPQKDKFMLILTHVCPAMVTKGIGGEFDIDRPLYAACCQELDRIAPDLMLCGHYHTPFFLSPEDAQNINPHAYPIVMGATQSKENFSGTAVHLVGKTAEIAFTDEAHTVMEKFTLEI